MPVFTHGKNTRVLLVASSASATMTGASGPLAITAVATSSPSAGYATYSTNVSHGLYQGSTVTITGFTPTAYNASSVAVTASTSPTSFTIASAATASISAFGGVSGLVGFVGNTGFVAGQSVTTTGFSPAAFNLTANITAANNLGFSVSSTATGTYSSGGTATTAATPYDLSQYFNDASLSMNIEATESTTFQTGSAKSYIKGLKDGTISLSGFYDGTPQGLDAILTNMSFNPSDDACVVFALGGSTDNERCWMAQGIETKYDLKTPVAGIVAADTEIQADAGVWNGTGKVFSIVGTGATASSVALNNSASSTNGGLLVMAVTALSGTITLNFQTSDTGISYTNVGSTITAVGAVINPISGLINQYSRLTWNLSSGGSATIFYGFARY